MLCFLLFIVSIHALTFSELRVEHLVDPLGITQTNPRFSWYLVDPSTTRGQAQTGYEIIVSSSPDCQNGDMWDSGKVSASKSYLNHYQGKPLNGSTRYYWKVRVWDMGGAASDYSNIATFVTGTSSWNGATWITGGDANNQLRTEFNVPGGTLQKSFLHISGLGYYELYCNGMRVGDHMLEVGWTDYSKRVYYVTWDLSEFIRPGTANAIGVVLGNSWFACAGGQPGCQKIPPQLLLTATIQTSAGSVMINSNVGSWKVSGGPITYNSLYNGEMYDARLETPGWTSPGFNQNGWKNPTAGSANPPLVTPQLFEPIRKLRAFSPEYIDEPQPGMFVVDFGQNTAGLVSITIRDCVRGQNVTLRHAELLMHPPYGEADGTIYTANLRGAKATDIYTCKGTDDGVEVYSPTFTQHGYRFVEVTGLTNTLLEDDITSYEMHTDVEEIGEVITTDPLINKIQHNIVWGQKKQSYECPN